MAIIQHSNGIIEDIKPGRATFTDDELIGLLENYSKIETVRLLEVPNTWCVWGVSENNPDIEYNKIASIIINEHVYSPLIIVHDTELDPTWNLNDDIILQDYESFRTEVYELIDEIATRAIEETSAMSDEDTNKMMILTTVGPTQDKKVLFEFSLKKQSNEFFRADNMDEFNAKVMDYWDAYFFDNIKVNDNFCVIYADSKHIIRIPDAEVDEFMKVMRDYSEKIEEYEDCSAIKNYQRAWTSYMKNNKQVKTAQIVKKGKRKTSNKEGNDEE